MTTNLIAVGLPLFSALLLLLISEKTKYLKELLSIGVLLTSLIAAGMGLILSMKGVQTSLNLEWLGSLSSFSLKADMLSSFLLAAVSMFSAAVSLYSFSMEKKGSSKWFYFNVLMTQALAAGAVLSDSLITMLFFWEGMLVFLYTFIALSADSKETKNTALKAFLINAVTDLLMIIGVLITGALAGSFNMSAISGSKLTLTGWATAGYVLMLIGAVAKAGAFPFHTWIPDAALNSSASFMSYVPAAIDKLLGIYFLARISLYLYQLDSFMQIVLMTLGAVTIIVAVMMAFVQQDYKRLLSYHAVSQTGYMILGIGTLNPIGIAGGLFHMINHATYKSCLFMTAGSVERQTGTNDIEKLGGLFWKMPVTAVCFIIAAAAISGIAPLNGFFSKELVYKGSLETGYVWFFFAAEIGSFLTLASFLKLGHSVFFGKLKPEFENVKESPFSVLFPMVIFSAICLAFGFGAYWPIKNLIEPSLAGIGIVSSHELAGFHPDYLFAFSLAVILLALGNHILGFNLAGKRAHKASDHIHHAPILSEIYDMAEKKFFDLYELSMKFMNYFSRLLFKSDRFFDKITDNMPSGFFGYTAEKISAAHSGSYSLYMSLSLIGALIYLFLAGGLK
ncbi:MAG: NADH dehydrogenase [Elusimicrobia bacterium]|nr:NADH dehydrogenase [Elusimicrobiota bacterium]